MFPSRTLKISQIVFSAALVLALPAAAEEVSSWGTFIKKPIKVSWGDNGRDMVLLENFIYKDPKGKIWGAPAGSKVDGASIPRAFWTVIGSPFTGNYREASVIHDVACEARNRPWKDVHLAFYQAMRCGGVSETQAKIMYLAVYHFGPRWGPGIPKNEFSGAERNATREDVQRAIKWIENNDPDLSAIERADVDSKQLRDR